MIWWGLFKEFKFNSLDISEGNCAEGRSALLEKNKIGIFSTFTSEKKKIKNKTNVCHAVVRKFEMKTRTWRQCGTISNLVSLLKID